MDVHLIEVPKSSKTTKRCQIGRYKPRGLILRDISKFATIVNIIMGTYVSYLMAKEIHKRFLEAEPENLIGERIPKNILYLILFLDSAILVINMALSITLLSGRHRPQDHEMLEKTYLFTASIGFVLNFVTILMFVGPVLATDNIMYPKILKKRNI